MIKKTKVLFYSASTAILTVPMVVNAQLEKPPGTGLPEATLSGIIQNLMYWMLWLVGILGVIGFALAGILYLTSAGDDTRMNKAKNAMLYSIIGVIVALAGLVALQAAHGLLGAQQKF